MDEPYGYTGKILRVDLSNAHVDTLQTSSYADRFLGGRGVALKIYWDEVSPGIDAYDPENRLIFMTGPVCGVPGFAGSRWQVCGKSPVFNHFSYANIGGAWGGHLKFAGYDGIVLQGTADALCYLEIDNDRVELKPADHLKGAGALETRKTLKESLGKDYRVVSIGPAGENRVPSAILLADSDSTAAGGFGAVMGSKNLKAVAVRGDGRIAVADPEGAARLRKNLKEIKCEPWQWPTMLSKDRIQRQMCHGCIDGCMRVTYAPESGPAGKYFCQSSVFYEIRAQRHYGEINDVPFQATRLCDDYGIDTRFVETMMMWLSRCVRSGALTDEETGIPLTRMGSLEFIKTLVHKIAFREGFGDVLADGVFRAAVRVGKDSDKLITDYIIRTGEDGPYRPRMYLTTGLLYATEPRMPIQQLHEVGLPILLWTTRETGAGTMFVRNNYMTSQVVRDIGRKFWGGEIAADFSTYEGKAEAAVKIQHRQYAKECLILCDFSWPFIHSPASEDHVGDPSLESRVHMVVTGSDQDEQALYETAERVFNLQRAVLVREGRNGRKDDTIEEYNFTLPLKAEFANPDCLVPGKDGEPFSRKGMVMDRDAFEKMKDQYYALRGWDIETGLQTRTKLEALGLGDIAEELGRNHLIVEK
jgi:aldehyde:ferredoxin oxidoreductase